MKAFFKDIFDYHNHFNQKLVDVFVEHSNKISERTIPLFSHCLNAHQIWNSRILNTKAFKVFQIHELKDCKSIDNSNYKTTIKIIETLDLNSIISYQNSKGQTFNNSIRDILFHAANHFTHHKGQIISDLRQNEIEPLITDYIFYKR